MADSCVVIHVTGATKDTTRVITFLSSETDKVFYDTKRID